MWHRVLVLFLTFCLTLSAAGDGNGEPINVPPPSRTGVVETGLASWYGDPYHGRHAANGEIYDMEQMTAAHKTLPFNTRVRVFNLTNRKSVDVRITDRGPFIDGRIIDLSRAAARSIGLLQPGVTPVDLEILESPSVPAGAPHVPAVLAGEFAVQTGAFRDRRNAERYAASLQARYSVARLVVREGEPVLWRVLVGSEATPAAAHQLALRLRQELGVPAFEVRID